MLKECRNGSGITAENAAMKLGVAERTLRDYEAKDDAPCDVVNKAAEIYNAPMLRHWKCSKCPLGHAHPEVKEEDIYASLLRITKTAATAKEDCYTLADIIEDGRITDEEMEPAEEIESRFRRLVELGASLLTNLNLIKNRPTAAKQ